MSILRLDRVRREVGTFVILDDVTAAIAVDDRIGLVGPNGAGKTTLLRLAAGRDEPDGGVVNRKRGLSIGLLAQESHFDAAFMAAPDLRSAVRHGAAHLETMAAELAAMEHDGRVQEAAYSDLQHQFDVLGGYTLDLRVDEALSGLGFTRDEWAKPPTALSGGEQTRATLARLVIAQPDLLLLDEPTNHLDIAAIEWLEEHLRRRHGALLVASHDRAFLDATVGRIWELRDRRLTIFRGDYSAYHRQREERDVRAAKDAEGHAESIEREKELVQRYRSHRKFSKMHEHEARLERLQAEQVQAPKATKKLRLPAGALAGGGASRSGEIVIRAEGLVVGYLPGRGAVDASGEPATEPKRVARVPFLAAQRGDRIGIVGPNGAGKTTLLRTIAGDLPPLDGGLSFGNAVQPGYLAQLRGAAIPGETVLDALLGAIPVTPGEARGFLARFLFRGDDVFKEVRSLSGGERSRLELALLGIMPSNLLLLDEPTNHLDIPAREAIEAFMTESPATLLVVSHDRRLLETVCTTLWVVDDGLAVPFDGGWKAWRAAVADGWTVHAAAEREAARLRGGAHGGRRLAGANGSFAGGGAVEVLGRSRVGAREAVAVGGPGPQASASSAGSAASASPDSSSASASTFASAGPATRTASRAARREKLSKDAYRRQKAQVDSELTRLGLRKTQLELSLGSPAIAANFVEMRRVTSELADVEQALAAAEDAWLEVEDRAP